MVLRYQIVIHFKTNLTKLTISATILDLYNYWIKYLYRAERGGPRGRAKLASLAVYNEDETNDLSDLGIGTSSASGKSSMSEDYDNNSVMVRTSELS